MDSSGAAVENAAIVIEVDRAGRCDGTEDWSRLEQVATDATGHYSAELKLGNSSGFRCVRVSVAGSGASTRGEVEFVGGCEATGPPGQLSVDLVIP